MTVTMKHWSTAATNSPVASGEPGQIFLPTGWDPSRVSTNAAVMHFHGRSAAADDHGYMLGSSFNDHPRALLDAGYAVISMDLGGPAPWANGLQAWDRANDAYTYVTSAAIGVSGGRVALSGHSMGGLGALAYMRNLHLNGLLSRIRGAWLWNPVLDMEAIYNLAGYKPAYTPGNASTGAYTSQASVTTITAGTAGSVVVTTAIAGGTPASGSLLVYTASGFVSLTYSSWTGSTFTIPTSNTGTATIPASQPVYTTTLAPSSMYITDITTAHALSGVMVAKNAQAAAVLSGATVQLTTAIPRNIQLKIAQASPFTFTINGFTLTATGVSTTTIASDTFTGVSSGGISVNWAANAAVSTTYANAGIGSISPMGNIAGYRTMLSALAVPPGGSSVPNFVINANLDDSVLGSNPATYWLAQIALGNVIRRTPIIGGDHNGFNVPTSEVIAFYDKLFGR